MGEIKSTLDLVMERTKNISFSEAEKAEHKFNEANKHIKGLVQKFQDRKIKGEKFRKDYDNLYNKCNLSDNKMLRDEIISRISVDKDNTLLFNFLSDFFNMDITVFDNEISNYNSVIKSKTLEKENKVRKDIAEKYMIKGSAIVPNLQCDLSWIAQTDEIKKKFNNVLQDRAAHVEKR